LIKICIGGDISFHRIDNFVWGDGVSQEMRNHNLVIANLEAPLTNAEKRAKPRAYYLKARPDSVKWLFPFDALSLANNHILDYSAIGLSETINCLREAGIDCFGAAESDDLVYKPYCYEMNGVKIAVFGASQFLRSKLNNPNGPAGILSKKLIQSISQFKSQGYFIIVMPHWGLEHIPYPSPQERKTARKFVLSGADLVVGSHPHEIQAYEIIEGKHVFYSLGNFVFSSLDFAIQTPRLYKSILLSIEIGEDHKYNVKTFFCAQESDVVELTCKEEALKTGEYLNQISEDLKLTALSYRKLFYDSFVNENLVRNRLKAKKLKDTQADSRVITRVLLSAKMLITKLRYIDLQMLKCILYMRIPILRKLILLLSICN